MATDGSNKAIRGPSFSAAEDLALARVWMSATESVADMNSDMYWERAAVAYKTQPEATIQRTGHSLRSRWGVLQRLVQKYLAADKLYRAAIPSGEVEDDTQENVMRLFKANNQVTTKKGKRDPVFKSVAAAHLLRSCPKFSSKIGGPSAPNVVQRPTAAGRAGGGGGRSGGDTGGGAARNGGESADFGVPSVRGRDEGEGEASGGGDVAGGGGGGGAERTLGGGGEKRRSGGDASAQQTAPEGVAATIPADSPGFSRPLGAKRKKLRDATEGKPAHAVAAVAQSMAGVKAALEDSTARKATLAAMSLEAKLLEMLPNGPDKIQRVRELLARTQQVNQAHESGSARPVSGDRGAVAVASAGERSRGEVAARAEVERTTEGGDGEGELV